MMCKSSHPELREVVARKKDICKRKHAIVVGVVRMMRSCCFLFFPSLFLKIPAIGWEGDFLSHTCLVAGLPDTILSFGFVE